jgi:hypothetical protein
MICPCVYWVFSVLFYSFSLSRADGDLSVFAFLYLHRLATSDLISKTPFGFSVPRTSDYLSFPCTPQLRYIHTNTEFSATRPGDYLKPGEDEIDGLKRRLDDRLAPPRDSQQFSVAHGIDNEWEIGDCLAQWWRPNFETFMVHVFSRLSQLRHLTIIVVSFYSCTHH